MSMQVPSPRCSGWKSESSFFSIPDAFFPDWGPSPWLPHCTFWLLTRLPPFLPWLFHLTCVSTTLSSWHTPFYFRSFLWLPTAHRIKLQILSLVVKMKNAVLSLNFSWNERSASFNRLNVSVANPRSTSSLSDGSLTRLPLSRLNLRSTSSLSDGSLTRLPLSRLLFSVHLFVRLNSTFISRPEAHASAIEILTVNSHLEHHHSLSSLVT